MFGMTFSAKNKLNLAYYLSEKHYGIAAVSDNKTLLFTEQRSISENTPDVVGKLLTSDNERLNLLGKRCSLILGRGAYQLIQMDAPDVSEEEMAKALRWRLKGLVDYPLNDIAIDAFLVPPHGVGKQRKKAFVAATLLSALAAKTVLFETAYLMVKHISIPEMALRNILSLLPDPCPDPIVVISMEEDHCQMQILKQNQFYLIRDLNVTRTTFEETSAETEFFLQEIRRSIDYCLGELKLPEPAMIYFTPGFYKSEKALQSIQQQLGKEVKLIDLNHCLAIDPPLPLGDQQDVFYAVGGAITYKETLVEDYVEV